MAGYIDAWGIGTLKIINSCKDAGLPEPEIIEKEAGVMVALHKSQVITKIGGQVTDQVKILMSHLDIIPKSVTELMDEVGLKHRFTFRHNYLMPAIELNLIELTVPDKPSSSKQKYKLTPLGLEYKHTQGK